MQYPRYLLVGGSNSILKDGYGAMLQLQLPGHWCNQSLGNSSSLRGVEYLLNHQASLDQIDQIFFEYTLNDLIFEMSNTLDPITHLDWLQCLVSVEKIREKLIFVLLYGHGSGASSRINSGHSFVVDNYRKIISQFGVRSIDLFPLIRETVETRGQAAVFKDNDHFTPHMVQALASSTIAEWTRFSVQPPLQFHESPKVNRKLVTINPLVDAHIHNATTHEFRTALLAAPLVKMTEASEIHFKSPGGALVGFYAIASHDAACVRITYQQREIVKAMRHRFGMAKPYLALRHLTTPLYTMPGEDILVRYTPDIFSVSNASLDNTMAQVINGGEPLAVEVGKFIFLVEHMNNTIYSTLKNTTAVAPKTNEAATVGRYLSYPDLTGKRIAQGGLRRLGMFNHTLPELPLVTIITVCLNSAKTMEQCIQSVLQQTYENIEYIIIDGGSSDSTLELIKKYEESIAYFVSEPDRGLYHAMNKGLELSTGDYILILNSDDWYAHDCVEALVKAKKYSGASFVSALAQYVDVTGKPLQVMRSMPYNEGLRLRMPLRHETMLLPAAIYNEIGPYDEEYRIIADFDLTIRLFEKRYTHYELPRPLLFFRNSGVSNTNFEGLFSERKKLIKKVFPFLEQNELELFGEIVKFSPDKLQNLADKYRHHNNFLLTLRSYFEDRKQNTEARHWRNSQIDWTELTPSNNFPLVSLILPVFNAEKTLAACIDSVLSQTLKNFELICINDVSSDKSQEIIERYLLLDKRIVSLVNEINIGCGATRNRGVRQAKGAYVFHIDPDDTIPPNALKALYECAIKHGSDMVKGAYQFEQLLFGQKPQKPERKGLSPASEPVINTSLAQMPDLLKTTEGHWSYLYKSDLAKRVPYPTDLKMGQDSIFIVSVLIQAKSVSIIGETVYNYRANPASAMNTFTFQKYKDALEWRRRAWYMLKDAGIQVVGDRLLQAYWSDAFFKNLVASSTDAQLKVFFERFRQAFAEAQIKGLTHQPSALLSELFPFIIEGEEDKARALMRGGAAGKNTATVKSENPVQHSIKAKSQVISRKLKVATFCSMDHGGAGTGTQRRVEALRKSGVEARIFSLVVKSSHPYVERVVPELPAVDTTKQMEVWKEVRKRAILRAKEVPGFCARELFSLTDSVVDFSQLAKRFDEYDVIHLHWVVGMFDYQRAGQYLGKKPVVWTLADMNAFTGGCHFSEGCEGYKKECQSCPLLGGKSNLAHEAWKIKKAAYKQLKNLHIICPSKWMAERAAESSLLGDKTIHYIPNGFPTERLKLTNKLVARIRLGLPINKKLLLFGADSLANYRKGGDLLKQSIDLLSQTEHKAHVEIIVFGNNSIDLPLPVHRLGYISDDAKLALVYSAADAYLFPSLEDNAPLTVGEALLSGTPVVAFPVGYLPDIIQHKVNGYIAKYLDAADFSKGIEWALNVDWKTGTQKTIGYRIAATSFHDPQLSVERHLAVYHEAIRNV